MSKIKKVVSLTLLIVFFFSLVLVPNAFAKDENAKKSLVALGDSITFGYGLENNLNHVSKKA